MKSFEEIRAQIRRLTAARRAAAGNAERLSGLLSGRRPRDREKKTLLGELDRLRLEKRELSRNARPEPVDGGEA